MVSVGSATESPLALSGPPPAFVSRGGDCYFFKPCCLPPTLALLLTAHCPVPVLCTVWGELPLQSSLTLVWLGALPARETWPPLPLFTQFYFDWANLGRLGTPLMSIWLCWASPYLHSLAWPSLCRLGPGASLVVLGDMHDLVQTLQTGPWCQLFPNLTWFSLTDWTPVSVWFV